MRHEVDEEFASYVRARQHRLLPAAYLVCGDAHLAEGLLRSALVKLALRWDRVRNDTPDLHVRRMLYRDAVSAWRRTRRDSIADVLPDADSRGLSAAVAARLDLERALATLTPRERGVVVLRFFEDRTDADTAEVLGISVGTVQRQTLAALARMRQRLPDRSPAHRRGAVETDRDLSSLLDRVAAELPEVDFVHDAWQGALEERARRRRRLLGGLGSAAAAALAVGTLNVVGVDRDREPTPQLTTTTPTTPPSTGALADRTRYAVMPLESHEGDLRQYDVGLPSRLDPAAPTTKLSTLDDPLPAFVAVYLRPVGEDYQPVLVTAVGQQVLVDELTLVPTRDDGGNAGSPLGVRAVGGSGQVVFAQPGAVVRLDARSGEVSTVRVPSQTVQSVGWTRSGGTLLIRSTDGAWTLDPWRPDAQVRPADPGSYDGLFRLGATTDTRSLGIQRYDGDGAPMGQRSVAAPVTELWGETVATEEWAAVGAFYDQNLTSALIEPGNGPIYQGLVAVDADRGPATILVAPESPDGQTGRFKGCCAVLGWADGGTVLFQSLGTHGSWVLAWDIHSGEVFKVMRIEVDAAKATIPRFALNVGWRY
jgi:RNA polymerase sigma-70 factor (sigma-E family)